MRASGQFYIFASQLGRYRTLQRGARQQPGGVQRGQRGVGITDEYGHLGVGVWPQQLRAFCANGAVAQRCTFGGAADNSYVLEHGEGW